MVQTNSEKISAKYYVVAGILILTMILGIAFAIVWYDHTEIQKMIDRECIPSGASDWLGNPTVWSCPTK